MATAGGVLTATLTDSDSEHLQRAITAETGPARDGYRRKSAPWPRPVIHAAPTAEDRLSIASWQRASPRPRPGPAALFRLRQTRAPVRAHWPGAVLPLFAAFLQRIANRRQTETLRLIEEERAAARREDTSADSLAYQLALSVLADYIAFGNYPVVANGRCFLVPVLESEAIPPDRRRIWPSGCSAVRAIEHSQIGTSCDGLRPLLLRWLMSAYQPRRSSTPSARHRRVSAPRGSEQCENT